MKRGICMTVVLAAGMLAVACTSGTEDKARSTNAAGGGSGLVKVEVFAKKACGATVPPIELVKSTLAEMKVPHDLEVT